MSHHANKPSVAESIGHDRVEDENGKDELENEIITVEGTATEATVVTDRRSTMVDTSQGTSAPSRRQGRSAASSSGTDQSSKHRGRVLSGILRRERLSTLAPAEGTARMDTSGAPPLRRSNTNDAASTLKSGWGRRSGFAPSNNGQRKGNTKAPSVGERSATEPPSATTTASTFDLYNALSSSEADEQGRHVLSGVAVSASRNDWAGTRNDVSEARTTATAKGLSRDGKGARNKASLSKSPPPPSLALHGRYQDPNMDPHRPGAVRIYPGGPVAGVAGRLLDNADDVSVTEEGSETTPRHASTRTTATSSGNYAARERHGLVEATLVVAEDVESDLGYAPDVMDLEQSLRSGELEHAQPVESKGWSSVRLCSVAAIVVCVAVALAVTLSATLPTANTTVQPSTGSDRAPTSAPTLSAISAEFRESLPSATLATMGESESSPQGRAFRWVASHAPALASQDPDPVGRMTQLFALATLFYATGGESSWAENDRWLNVSTSLSASADMNECNWLGCSCDINAGSERRALNALRLPENGLMGPLPPEISLLSNLQMLDLRSNGLSGAIPKELSNLSKLEHLDLELNVMKSEIPTEMGNLSRLTSLNLGSCYLTGTIPTNLGRLSTLSNLNLGGNVDLGGTIPSELGGLVNLGQCVLSSTAIRGSIPTQVGELGILKRLELFGSRIAGSIPVEVGRLTDLEALDLSDSSISGSIPSSIGMLSSLHFLNLANCALGGHVPSEMFGALRLSDLRLCNNSFTGALPTEIGRPSLLRVAKLHSNAFRGTLPTELGNLSSLLRLEVFFNNLSGAVPTELCNRISAGLVLVMDCDKVTCNCGCHQDNCAKFEG